MRCEVVQMKRDELRKAARKALEKLIHDVEAGISETLKQYLKAMGRFLGQRALGLSCGRTHPARPDTHWQPVRIPRLWGELIPEN